MKCPRCQQDNPPQAKFCLECAAPLALRCASCGTQLPPGAKFCFECATPVSGPGSAPRFASPETYTPKHLAERIINSKAALEGERKQVTVLFADLKGSMELLADRDPEEARKVLDPVLERMMEAVHRYEGTVNQVMGDGIMALFGAPLAHEDHAVRACYAALRMQESVKQYSEDVQRSRGINVQIRVGLNSGEVVVRSIGSDLRMDYTAVGQTTHLAARMEQLATPGTICLTADTLRLAEGYIQAKPLGPIPIKGLNAPFEIYEVVGPGPVRSRLEAAATRGLTRFVGRDTEVDQLREALEQSSAGHGQLVATVGEPGVGKSRLFHEFTHSHRVHEDWLVLQSGAVSYGKATSYLPIVDLLKGYFSLHDPESRDEIRAKVTGKIMTLDRDLELILPALLALLDVSIEDAQWRALDPGQRRLRTLDGVKRLLLRESRAQPVLVVLEDLHWIDAETQAFLESLVESLPTARLLLLVNYRPEYQHAWRDKTYYTELRLDALPRESAVELLLALLGADATVEPLKPVLIARTRGNPLFLEENVRALVEIGALAGERGAYRLVRSLDKVHVPATVQGILASRIDRLASQDKQLLQTASVVGKDVPFALLRDVVDLTEADLYLGLVRLQTADFLYETSVLPDLEYTFKHALTHEVAYSSLLHERRRTLHARLVEALEALHGDRLAEHLEPLAHHALRGGLLEKATVYLRQAGVRAVERSALKDARVWFEQALGVLQAQPESHSTLDQAFEIHLALRPVLAQLSEPRLMLEHLRDAEAIAQRLNDPRRRGGVCAFMTNSYSLLGELDEARASGTRALSIAQGLGNLELGVVATTYLEQAHYFLGDYARVVNLATENLRALSADRTFQYLDALPSVDDRYWLVMSLAELGRFTEAAECGADGIRLAGPTQHQHAYALVQAQRAAARLYLVKGVWAKARTLLEQVVTMARTANLGFFLPDAIAASAWALAQLGEADEAVARIREGEQLLKSHAASGLVGRLGSGYHALGRATLLLGQLDQARDLGDRAVEFSPQQRGFAAYATHLLGDIAFQRDRTVAESAETPYRQALALAESRGMRPLVAHCHLGLGKLYHRTDKHEQAQEHLATATTMYGEMGMTYWLEKADAEVTNLGT
jgi:class 3 adenylate cyclase/tetratricopeptide (TPR) repeat protein